MTDEYENGLRDGKIQSLGEIVEHHGKKHDKHETRFLVIERILYGFLGALFLVQVMPLISEFLKKLMGS